MEKTYDFDLSIQIPSPSANVEEMIESVYESGYTDAVVGTGNPEWLGVMVQEKGSSREEAFDKVYDNLTKTLHTYTIYEK